MPGLYTWRPENPVLGTSQTTCEKPVPFKLERLNQSSSIGYDLNLEA